VTTVNITVKNLATKQETIVSRFKVVRSRKHGRPRNVGKVWKGRRLPTPVQSRGAEDEIVREVAHPLDPSHKSTIKSGRVRKES
jgi:hypothetical protein